MAESFLTEAEARSARACALSTLEELVERQPAAAQTESSFPDARLEAIAERVRQGYILSEEEKEVLREASERED